MNDLINNVILPVLGTVLTALISYLGVKLKALLERKEIDATKRAVAKTCVEAVEQIYKSLHGAEKFYKAADALSTMLAERGIAVSDFELQMLIESAVQSLNANILQPLVAIPEMGECADCQITYSDGGELK